MRPTPLIRNTAARPVDQYAIYDPELGEWIITDFD